MTPAYESPGPFPGSKRGRPDEHAEPARTLGQPAPRGARWQPGSAEDSGPTTPSWQPPDDPVREESPQATVSDSVWQAPSWLRPAEPARPSPTPTWTPPLQEQKPATPTWAAPTTPPAPTPTPAWTPPAAAAVDPPAWSPEPTRARTPRIPELGLDPEAEPKPGYAGAFPKDDDEFVDGGFGDEFEDEFEDRPAGSVAAVEAQGAPKPGKPEAPAAAGRPKAKPPKDADDDDFDDDDDDFDDDDDDEDFDVDEDDSRGSMAGEIVTSSTAAPVPQRKLPWIPIALVASVLVMVSAYAFRDAIFGTSDDEVAEGETGEVADPQPEPEPPPPEPEPEPKVEPEPEPPPPAIPAEELEAKLAEATNLLDRQKHTDAAKIIDEILEKIPKEPRALALRGFSQLEKRKHDDALATANECVGIDAKQATCWITIAVVEQEKNNLPRALEGYRKYLELEPDGRFAKVAKGQVDRLSAKVEG